MPSLMLYDAFYRLEWNDNTIGSRVRLTFEDVILFNSPIKNVLTYSPRMKILKLENNLTVYVEMMYDIRYPNNNITAYVAIIDEDGVIQYKFRENNIITPNPYISEFISIIHIC